MPANQASRGHAARQRSSIHGAKMAAKQLKQGQKPREDKVIGSAKLEWRGWRFAIALVAACLTGFGAQAADPIRIGVGMALTGGLASNGKAALMTWQMWADEVNAKGGLLGRKVEFVHYDDQSNPAAVPGIYTKLLDIDKVDLVVSGYGTNLAAPAMPIVMQRNLMFIGLFALALNTEFNYPNYFTMFPVGPEPKTDFTRAFFDLAMSQNPKPQSLAIVAADAEYSQLAAQGAREHAKRLGLKTVYDRSYPPATVDFTPIVRAVQAANPDIVFVGSYPPDSAGMVRAASEIGLKTKQFGGAMAGLQFASIKTQLGPLLNGVVDYDFYVPEPTLKFPGIERFLERYQAKAAEGGVDPLGFYLPPFAYAGMQVMGQAVETTKSLDQKTLADYIHKTTFKTIVGDVAFAANGEWKAPRVIYTQARGIVGNDLEQWKQPGKEVILAPAEYKSGALLYPYSDLKR
jgi:branched-chain amino acid transport system substrate-binding protein